MQENHHYTLHCYIGHTRTTPARRLAMHVQGGRIKEHLSSHQIYFIYFHHVILCRGVMPDLVKGTSNIDKQNL